MRSIMERGREVNNLSNDSGAAEPEFGGPACFWHTTERR